MPSTQDTLRGVKGWLLFFCVYFSIISPILYLAQILQLAGISIGLMQIIQLAISFGLIVYAAIIGIRLWRIRPNSLKQAKTMLIVVFCFKMIGAILLFASSSGSSQLVLRAMPGIFIIFLWWYYLNYSKRVRNTYTNQSI